ncbi:SgcJ/EcaC family oxidoreductase [Roseibium alexandrii]|uniref:DUF4440 domain-containing protein n=1 Tax=Roseibium alexandrii (strain DSM 17067 / NCIMB 14079 / DFL-11) TaxID=244592 RepID=A0A5E8GT63_ROSAD|nr:SgcJ/EcaC family oxidoreductase [Roseibium alexandrii]EEE43023.1 hypothetical protein SADFL11_309 [Roseibium alexandrii DFL-11]
MTQRYETGEEITRAFFEAWNAQDLDRLAGLFVEDADFVNVVGLWWTTRRQIRKAHDYGFRKIFQKARVEIVALKSRPLGDDVEVVHTVSTLDGQTDEHGIIAGQRTAVITIVAHRQREGGFRIESCQNTDRVDGADTHLNTGAGFRPASN